MLWPRPMTPVVKKSPLGPQETSAGLDTVGVRFPSNKFAQEFIKACGCPLAAPSANLSGRPSPTNAHDVLEDMQGKIAAILDGGACGIGVESTVIDTTEPVPVILRPGGITYEMLVEALGAVELDPALEDNENFKPKAPGMKYRHYAPKSAMYLLEGEAAEKLAAFAAKAVTCGKSVGVLCSSEAAQTLPQGVNVSAWGASREELAANLFYLLRDLDRSMPDVILAEGIDESGIGLAIMNRMRKAAGYQIVTSGANGLQIKNGVLPDFMIK